VNDEDSGRASSMIRSEYLIDRFRVVFESGGGWHCTCADYAKSKACRHSREAAGMRSAQARIRDHVAAARSELRIGARPHPQANPAPSAGEDGP
jgi:hypothetical protein